MRPRRTDILESLTYLFVVRRGRTLRLLSRIQVGWGKLSKFYRVFTYAMA